MKYLKEMSSMAAGSVAGAVGPAKSPPDPLRGGDDDEEPEDATQPIIRRGQK